MAGAIVDVVNMMRLFPNASFQLLRADGTLGPVQGGKRESDDLALAIAEATDKAIHSDAAWTQAHADLAAMPKGDQLVQMARFGDDDAQLGRAFRTWLTRQVIANAEDEARDAFAKQGEPA